MKTLLRIDASLRKEGSHSRALADFFEINWKKKYPGGEVLYRDLTNTQIPHLQNETVQAFHIPKSEQTGNNKLAVALSDALIEELQSADHVLISSPLYNLNVPSTLKSYLDHIVRSGYTFSVSEDGSYKGLLDSEAAYIITTKGETYKGTSMEALDFQEPYLKSIFGFMGLKLKAIFSLEATAHPNLLENNLRVQKDSIRKELMML
ncbi:FMN-dependent NADH-azoreductase [Flagellimonas allohymeniacidonis]|uniref:FMN dependent NADH:quinone oxidoreductase n=1 Tax=Flagellimonas allohymeniacidonis TaxID=2517819 RepID=A0A4Q8QLJ6_9FLAO|nr:NAD(P)H-dependent oxidoreductase [Allomuricauda hymeniacidonis]TAI49136.1 FMN-dependent NADH-azoreductase [Allomuricauda hymeniacidonis]